MKKRYYVGSDSMTPGRNAHHFLRESVTDTIAEARKRLEKDSTLKEVYVVEVIHIVRRATPPVELIDAKTDLLEPWPVRYSYDIETTACGCRPSGYYCPIHRAGKS